MINKLSACRYAAPLDTVGIVATHPADGVLKERLAFKSIVNRFMVLSTVGLFICLAIPMSNANAIDNADSYRIYAHVKIYSYEQYQCFDRLMIRESHWNPKATNGNHYGIPQGLSKNLIHMSGYQQIDWAIAYIHARYTYACNALNHSMKKGWY